ncbi:MAG TPA: NAD(P)/FAD-dependent oxidoreductase [Bryobacteraceae bacterium]|nr:NAD(P)/FAD-dependent oxidoreductase [Bryobacteraceae bacterium]
MNAKQNSVAVIGGGVSGLVSAYRLLQKGNRVTLLEASEELGGLGGTFQHEGHTMEQFYHVMINTDENLLALLQEVGLSDQISWTETKMGFLYGKKLYPFNTPLDLLGFGGLSLWGRLRTAFGGAYIAKLLNDPKGLDRVSVSEWLEGIFGSEVFAQLWRPLLRAKFGDMYAKVPAYWFWTRLRREKGSAKEVKGYVNGGYRHIADRLRDEIRRMGGVIRMRTAVAGVQEGPRSIQLLVAGRWETYDAAVSTLPLPLLHGIAQGKLESMVPRQKLAYQGVVNAVAILKKRLQPNYWNAIVQKGFPFQGLVETTHVVPMEQTGGRHLVYLLNYCGRESELYRQPDGDIKFQALKAMRAFNAKFSDEWIEDIRVFRAPFVEPVWPLGYQTDKPRMRCGDSRLYLATTAQCYPQVNSWNTMVGIANDAASRVQFDLENTYNVLPPAAIQPPPILATIG